jgi:ribosomal RNA-processing protein 8
MFSVPGWNVSAAIATQVEKPKAKDPNKLGKKALKRKEKQEQEVNAENVGEMWDKAVKEGDAKVEKTPKALEVPQNAGKDTGAGAEEKRGKKRKREKKSRSDSDVAEAELKAKGAKTVENAAEKLTTADAAETPTTADAESKRDKKKRKKDAKAQSKESTAKSPTNEVSLSTAPVALIPEPAGLTPLQRTMRAKLASARFRHLNESLYTKPSAESLDLFKDDPSMFEDYHRGFAQQVEVWPENPVDSYVTSILARGKIRPKDTRRDNRRHDKKPPQENAASETAPLQGDAKPLPRGLKSHATIADLGCGTASLSHRLQPHLKKLNLTLHSYDLSRPSGPSAPLVTVADISALPLQDGSVDVAIFCLALMGTNWLDFIDEAYRILRWRGELWISEIKSRFGRVDKKKGKPPINSIGSLKKPDKKAKKKAEKPEPEGIVGSDDEAELAERVDGAEGKEGTDVGAFIEVLRKRGFVLDALPERQDDAVDLSNKMFVKMQFVKSAPPIRGKNAKAGAEEKKGGGDKGIKMGMKGKKFDAVKGGDDGKDEEKDMKVLKPCLYKIR